MSILLSIGLVGSDYKPEPIVRIKVIVRQVGNGAKHFWSVIPGWRKIRGAVSNARGDLSRQ